MRQVHFLHPGNGGCLSGLFEWACEGVGLRGVGSSGSLPGDRKWNSATEAAAPHASRAEQC